VAHPDTAVEQDLQARAEEAVARARELTAALRSRAMDNSVEARSRAEALRADAARLREERQHYRNMLDELKTLVENLQRALESRAGIEQAKGIIMAMRRCTPDEAFDALRVISQQSNRKLVLVAAEVVERAQRPSGRAAPPAS
jgi:predicted nuclease with TOPRIM domain